MDKTVMACLTSKKGMRQPQPDIAKNKKPAQSKGIEEEE